MHHTGWTVNMRMLYSHKTFAYTTSLLAGTGLKERSFIGLTNSSRTTVDKAFTNDDTVLGKHNYFHLLWQFEWHNAALSGEILKNMITYIYATQPYVMLCN